MRPYLEKNPSQKRAGGVAQGVGPEFKPHYHKRPGVQILVPPKNISKNPMLWV
jgi:hypothetical protein